MKSKANASEFRSLVGRAASRLYGLLGMLPPRQRTQTGPDYIMALIPNGFSSHM